MIKGHPTLENSLRNAKEVVLLSCNAAVLEAGKEITEADYIAISKKNPKDSLDKAVLERSVAAALAKELHKPVLAPIGALDPTSFQPFYDSKGGGPKHDQPDGKFTPGEKPGYWVKFDTILIGGLCVPAFSLKANGYFDKKTFLVHKSDFEKVANILGKHRLITFVTPVRISFSSGSYTRDTLKAESWLDADGKKIDLEKVLQKNDIPEQEFKTLMKSLSNIMCAASCSGTQKSEDLIVIMFFPPTEKPPTPASRVGLIEYASSRSGHIPPEFLNDKYLKSTPISEKWYLMERAP